MENKIGYKDIFRQKEFMKSTVSQMLNRFGDSIDAIALTWIVYELTENAAWSALAYGFNWLPTVLVTPFAGAWVEKKRKKTVVVCADILRIIFASVIATGYLMGFLTPWLLILLTMLISTVEAFRVPANAAMISEILEKKYYEHGMPFRATLNHAAGIAGTAAAAGIIAVFGSAGALYVDISVFILSVLLIMTLRVKKSAQEQKASEKGSYWSDFRAGIQYVLKSPVLLCIVLLGIASSAIGVPIDSQEAPLAKEILRGGAEIVSILSIGSTVGALLGTVAYPKVKEKCKGKLIVAMGVGVTGIFYAALLAGQPFYGNHIFQYTYLMIISIALGLTTAWSNTFLSVELVKQSDEAYLARVNAFYTTAGAISIPVVSFLVSGISMYLRIQTLYTIMSVICILGGILLLFVRALDATDVKVEQKTECEGS